MKKILLLIILLLVVTGCGNKSLLVVSTDYHLKSAATFGGTAIFDDGSVYNWYYSSTKREYNSYVGGYSMYTKDGLEKFVLEKASLSNKKVSKSDLEKIKDNIKKLKKPNNCQNGDVYSDITIFQNNEVVKFATSGNCDVTGNYRAVKELAMIIDKYQK